MLIGELSTRTGVSARSLRYYEAQGLLVSERTPNGYRWYTEEHVERVGHIQKFLAAGMSSRAIAGLAPCLVAPSNGRARRAMQAMQTEREKLSAAIEHLSAARQALDGLIQTNAQYLEDHPEPRSRRSPRNP